MTLDYIIVIVMLLAVALIGIISSNNVNSIREFAVSSGNYGVFVLMATLSASFIGGGFSTGNASKVAEYGIGNIFALMGFSVSIFCVGKFIVPRIAKFTNAISTGEVMRDSYGKTAQIFTGIFGMMVCAGILGAQIKAIGYMFNIFLGLDPILGALIGYGIVLFYSTVGGIKAVVFTDVVQFIVLSIGMPLLIFFAVRASGGVSHVVESVPSDFFNLTNGYSLTGYISLFLSLAIGEALVPPYVQRLLMGSDLKTTSRATIYSAIISIPFFTITGLVGLVGYVYFQGQGVDTNSIMQSVISETAPIGIRGLIIASMLSIVMSSADSFLNSASVSVVNDVIVPLRSKRLENKDSLKIARIANLFIGILAVVLALQIPNVLDILLFSYSLWSPVILVPLAAAMLGYGGNNRAFIWSMIVGGVTSLVWQYGLSNAYDIDGTIIGFIANLITFISIRKFTQNK